LKRDSTATVEEGYMSEIPAKNLYKSKFTGCKSIQPLAVPSESIHTLTLLSHFVVLQHEFKMN